MNRFSFVTILAAAAVALSVCSCEKRVRTCCNDDALLALRLRQTSTESDAKWEDTYQAIKENLGCCDEVWFATGIAIPELEFHREHAQRLARAKQQLEALGITVSIQIQATIGHGDSLAEGIEEQFSAKTWGGWTGSTGVEARYCNCPRQPEFLKYMQEMTAIYAPLNFHSMWIDDDLRYGNHYPATKGSLLGCWCDTCIDAFNRENNSSWTRKTLSKEVKANKNMADLWRKFSTESLQNIANIIAQEVEKFSPETEMGLQHTNYDGDIAYQENIITTLAEASGQSVKFRPGAGNYYDASNADGQITKSMQSVKHMSQMDKTHLKAWCPEIESWPRVYGSRTARGIQVEGFTALAYGADAISYFVVAGEKESASVYSYALLRPLAEASKVFYGYKRASQDTQVVGYQTEGNISQKYQFARSGMPVLLGDGVSLGQLELKDMVHNPTREVSTLIQARRDDIDSRHPSPVLCLTPYIGLIIPRIDERGDVRTIALINTRIDSQYKIRLRIGSHFKRAVWHEMREEPIKLQVQRDGEYSYVEIAEIQAWNCGYIELK